ncbi:MAG: LysM peptidoglycan-binding domain-containing protein [Smithella sp.]|nr:LysM peptidoglycan-binding domain-containing protein [Smithella sp.]
MFKRFALMLSLIVFCAALICPSAIAKEDTAQIRLKKTAVSPQKLYTYTVKRGDTLSSIIRNIPGITEDDLFNNYEIIKELNPNLKNPDRLEVGQSLVLPGRPITDGPETERISRSDISRPAFQSYKIKTGDTLYKIIRRELKVDPARTKQTLQTLKAINPNIHNVNRIYAGDVIKLPGKTVFVKAPEDITPFTDEWATGSRLADQPARVIEIKEKKSMPPEARLAVLQKIITQMNGTITTTGNYYLPIPKAGQVTIDCSKIPLVEFDDNTTVFVDMEDRTHNNLKKMISDNWTNFFLVKVDRNDDTISILRKIINSSKNYSMNKANRPLVIGSVPPVEVMVDWVITKSGPRQQPLPIQGIRSIYEDNLLLPKSVKNYYEKNGFILTEISEETGIVGKPDELYSLPPIPVFPTTSAKDLSYALLTHLGFKADKDVDIQVFDAARDGFNLAIKADVLIRKDDYQYIISSQNLSPQFISSLKQTGHETIFVNDNDTPQNNIEEVLRRLGIPFNSGIFTFSGLDRKQAPYSLKFNGIKINDNLYVVNFDFDQELRGLLQEIWLSDIAIYL